MVKRRENTRVPVLTPPLDDPPPSGTGPPEQTMVVVQYSISLEAQDSHLSQTSGWVPSRKPAQMALKTFYGEERSDEWEVVSYVV